MYALKLENDENIYGASPQYQVFAGDKKRKIIESGSIPKGEKVSLHMFDPRTNVSVSIRMEG